MLLVQLREMKNFTNHERDVAEYILGHMDQIPDISAGELARAPSPARLRLSGSAKSWDCQATRS